MNNSTRPNGSGSLVCFLCMLAVTSTLLVWESPAAAQEQPVQGSSGEEVKSLGYDDGFFLQTADRRFLLKTNALLQVLFEADLPALDKRNNGFLCLD